MANETVKTDVNEFCPTCRSTQFIYDYIHGEIVCIACGTVIKEGLIDLGPEWKNVDGDRRRSRTRVGPPIKPPFDLTTTLDQKDANGETLSLRNKLKALKFKKLQKSAKPPWANSTVIARELERLKSIISVPKSCVEQALMIYRIAYNKGLIGGYSPATIAAAALYAACRMLKVPRTAKELARYAETDKFKILRVFKAMADGLEIPPPSVVDYVRVVANRLGLDANTTAKAIEIARKIKNAPPETAAAAAIYLAAQGRVTMKRVAAAANITDVSLRTRLRKMGLRPNVLRHSAEEKAVLGPYMLIGLKRRKDVFIIRGNSALELVLNLREIGVIPQERVKNILEKKHWRLSLDRSTLAELGAVFKR